MSNINTVNLTGNLTREVELRETKSGVAVANLGLAVNRSVKDANDNWEDVPSFFEVTVFGGRAEQAARKLDKGSFVTVSGRLEQQRWETDEGEKRSKVVVIAQNIEGADFFKKAEDSKPAQTSTEGGDSAAAGDDDIPF